MATVFDVDTYICDRLLPARPGKVARHKLAYACYRYSAMTRQEPIFTAFCAAMPLGPVFVELLKYPARKGNRDDLSAEDKAIIDAVLK